MKKQLPDERRYIPEIGREVLIRGLGPEERTTCIEEAVAHARKIDIGTIEAMDLFAVLFGCYDPATSQRLFIDYDDAAQSGLLVDVVAGLIWKLSGMEIGWQPDQPPLFSVTLPPELAVIFPPDRLAWGLQRDWQATVLLCESAYLALYEENQHHVAWVVHVLTGRHLLKGTTIRAFWLALFKARERGWRSIAKPAAYVKAVAWRERPWVANEAWLVGGNGRRGRNRAEPTKLKIVIDQVIQAYDQVVCELEAWPEVVAPLLEQLGDERNVESRVREVLDHAAQALAARLESLGRLELPVSGGPLCRLDAIDQGACCQVGAGGVHDPHCQRRVYSSPERECPAALRFDLGRSARPLKRKRQANAALDPDEQFVYRTLKPKGAGHRESQNFVRLYRVQGLPEKLDPDVERVLQAKSGGIKYGLPEYLSSTTGGVWTARRVDATRQRIARMRRCIRVETIEVPNLRMYGELAAGGWHIENPRVIRKAAGEPRSSPTFIRKRIYDLAVQYPHAPWIAGDRDSRETFSLVYAHAPWILANPEVFGLQASVRPSTDFVFDRSTGFPGGVAGSQPIARPKRNSE